MTLLRGLCVLLLLAAACDSLGSAGVPATQQAEMTALAVEATRISDGLVMTETSAAATGIAAETYIAQVDGINRQVIATLRAGIPPTPQIVTAIDPSLPVGTVVATTAVDALGMTGSGAGSAPGIAQFLQFTQTASAVRESDGCSESATNQFSPSVPRIYATARALNVSAGTEMSVEWSFSGQVVYTSSFVVEQNSPDFCFWFFITPEDVPFTPGPWSVRILVNGAPIQPFTFTILD